MLHSATFLIIKCILNCQQWIRTVITADSYRDADKSLARPERKQANVSVRMA